MSIGIWQLVLVLVIVFVLFGAGKLPRVMSDLGKGVRSLKEGLQADKNPPSGSNNDVVTTSESERESESDLESESNSDDDTNISTKHKQLGFEHNLWTIMSIKQHRMYCRAS